MIQSLEKTKFDPLLLLPLLRPQPTQKFKQQQPKITQFKYENSTKASKLHFSDLQCIYICIYAYIHMLQLIEILRSVTNGPESDMPDILNIYSARST